MAEYTDLIKASCDWDANKIERQELARRGLAGSSRVRFYDFVWILWSCFFFIEPVSRHNARFWAVFLVFYTIFVALYCGFVLARTRRQTYLFYGAMGALAIGFFPFVNSSLNALIYIAAFAPFTVESVYTVIAILGAISSVCALQGYLLHVSPWAWAMTIFVSLIVGVTNLFTAQKVRTSVKLHSAYEEIEQLAKLAERERIARDLHDVLGHTLSVIVLKAELAGRLFSRDPERARQEIADVEQVSRKALTEVREAIRGYRSEGLSAEIERAQRTLDAAGVTLVCDSKPPALSPADETVLALAVREAVTNIVRHAHASQCRLRFVSQNGRTFLTVEDDGKGNIRQEGNGIRGMRERIESLGGRFTIDGRQGTRINIEIPSRSL